MGSLWFVEVKDPSWIGESKDWWSQNAQNYYKLMLQPELNCEHVSNLGEGGGGGGGGGGEVVCAIQ